MEWPFSQFQNNARNAFFHHDFVVYILKQRLTRNRQTSWSVQHQSIPFRRCKCYKWSSYRLVIHTNLLNYRIKNKCCSAQSTSQQRRCLVLFLYWYPIYVIRKWVKRPKHTYSIDSDSFSLLFLLLLLFPLNLCHSSTLVILYFQFDSFNCLSLYPLYPQLLLQLLLLTIECTDSICSNCISIKQLTGEYFTNSH